MRFGDAGWADSGESLRDEAGQKPCYLGKGTCWRETDRAVLVKLDSESEERWLPKSVIHSDSEIWEDGQRGELFVLSWWAEKNNLA